MIICNMCDMLIILLISEIIHRIIRYILDKKIGRNDPFNKLIFNYSIDAIIANYKPHLYDNFLERLTIEMQQRIEEDLEIHNYSIFYRKKLSLYNNLSPMHIRMLPHIKTPFDNDPNNKLTFYYKRQKYLFDKRNESQVYIYWIFKQTDLLSDIFNYVMKIFIYSICLTGCDKYYKFFNSCCGKHKKRDIFDDEFKLIFENEHPFVTLK